MSNRKSLNKWTLGLIGVVWALLLLFPFYWVFTLSLKTDAVAFTSPPPILFQPTIANYLDLLSNTEFPRTFGNSLIIAAGTVILSLVMGVPAAYALSRWDFRAKKPFMIWVLILRLVPGLTYIIPFFVIFNALHILDRHVGMIVIYSVFNIALVIWSMQAFFDEVPRTLEESAYVDGATLWQGFTRIVLPLAGPGLAATAVLCFLFSWNEFLFALVLTRFRARTAPLAITNFMAFEGAEWGRIAAASIIILLPVMLFAVVVRRYLVKGLLAGAVKG